MTVVAVFAPMIGAVILLAQLGMSAWRLRPGVAGMADALLEESGPREVGRPRPDLADPKVAREHVRAAARQARRVKSLRMLTRGGLLAVVANGLLAFALVRLYFPLGGALVSVWVVAVALMGFLAFRVVQLWPAQVRDERLVARLRVAGLRVRSNEVALGVAKIAVVVALFALVWFASRLF